LVNGFFQKIIKQMDGIKDTVKERQTAFGVAIEAAAKEAQKAAAAEAKRIAQDVRRLTYEQV
jgi:hypothetical protein